jgi:hypothetical protein
MLELRAVGAALWLALPSVALAAPGVLEINHACAVNTGCFTGDTAGYPVTITQPGSYILSSNLVIPNTNTTGLFVSNDDVGIDLNGFAIIGTGCVGATSNCTPGSGTGDGIDVDNTLDRRALSIRNGSIVGMGRNGVRLAHNSAVRDLRVSWNRLNGVGGQSGILVTGSLLYQNGGAGIRINAEATITNNVAFENGSTGIECGTGSTVAGNASYNNGARGIVTALGSTITGNAASDNADDGIIAGTGSTVTLNAAANNGGDGIQASNDALVQRNTVGANGGYGLNLASDAAYRENMVVDNTAGTVNGGLNLGDNACNGNTTCP